MIEFPFVSELDRAVALAGLLTAPVSPSMETVPVEFLRAHAPGTGKSYLADLICALATGNRCPVIGYNKDEAENEKRLGAMIMAGTPVISLDNADHDIGGGSLCQVTERPLVRH